MVYLEFELRTTQLFRNCEHIGQYFVGESNQKIVLDVRRFRVHPYNKINVHKATFA